MLVVVWVVLVGAIIVHAAEGSMPSCQTRLLSTTRVAPPDGPPPTAIPPDTERAFTRCGAIPVERMYVDDSGAGGAGTHYAFTQDQIEQYVAGWRDFAAKEDHRREQLRHGDRHMKYRAGLLGPASSANFHAPAHKDRLLLHAARAHAPRHIAGKRVAVFGSVDPRVEALALMLGARHVTTYEWNTLALAHPRVTTRRLRSTSGDDGNAVDEPLSLAALRGAEVVAAAWDAGASEEAGRLGGADAERARRVDAANAHGGPPFDAVFSVSSFDHDGLGRYGDPLCADGDLRSMDALRAPGVLRGGGAVFLTVPVGADVLVWNLHRRYGAVRLPLLLAGWRALDVVALDKGGHLVSGAGDEPGRWAAEREARARAAGGSTFDDPAQRRHAHMTGDYMRERVRERRRLGALLAAQIADAPLRVWEPPVHDDPGGHAPGSDPLESGHIRCAGLLALFERWPVGAGRGGVGGDDGGPAAGSASRAPPGAVARAALCEQLAAASAAEERKSRGARAVPVPADVVGDAAGLAALGGLVDFRRTFEPVFVLRAAPDGEDGGAGDTGGAAHEEL